MEVIDDFNENYFWCMIGIDLDIGNWEIDIN